MAARTERKDDLTDNDAQAASGGTSPIVTKLAQLVRLTEQVKPSRQSEANASIRAISELAHTLVEEVTTHLKRQDARIAELENLATTDALTKVLNRRGFEESLCHELSIAKRHGVGGVLIFVDLDEFKPINDTYGHAAGDEVLVTVANLLKIQVRDTDYIGRLGGDEFAILLPRSNKRNGVRRAEDLDQKLNNAYAAWDGQNIKIKASCGVHMYAADAEVKELLESADAAMYKIKQERKQKFGIKTR
ncbi:MAG: GGDEF domain-containing protein [Rhodobacteraceae bacterium]|nr:GGDEF domain-containing protein [Paracoccaceae bacterium]